MCCRQLKILFLYFSLSFIAIARNINLFLFLFLDWLNTIVEEHEKTFDENNIRDFIDAFIVEKRKEKDGSFKVRN